MKDLNLSSQKLKEIVELLAQKRGIKGYESMPEDAIKCSYFIKTSKKSEKPKINFSKPGIEKIRKEFNESRQKFSKSNISKIRRNLYEIKNKKILFALRMEKIEKKP